MYPMKTCTNCGTTKECTEFNKHSGTKDGLQFHCKDCRKQKYINNPQPARERSRVWREKNPEKDRERVKQWRITNLERKKANNKAWHERTKEERKQRDAVERPGYRTWSNNRKRARKAGVACYEEYTVEIGLIIQSIYDSPCIHCGTKHKVELDHIVSMAQGGDDLKHNWQPLCRSCNARKGAATRDLVGPALERERKRIVDGLNLMNLEPEIVLEISSLIYYSKENASG